MASALGVMEKPMISPIQHQQQKSHEALKCPRCDSSNTKFCYYNNYSLSQPRHFCKACKRYWTRGGTLRNVPVGGGCRKNKRVKRPITTTAIAPNPSPVNPQRNTNHPITNHHHHHLNPLFYGLLPSNPNNIYPRFDHPRASSVNETPVTGYDHLLQPHVNASGMVFSSSGAGMANHGRHNQSLIFSSYMNNSSSIMYGGGSTTSCSTSMASLLASSLNQQQTFMELAGYDGGSMVKDLKMEATESMMKWNNSNSNFHEQNKNDHIEGVVSSDPNSIICWDNNEGGGWLDSTNNNIGSSVPSLI